MKVIKVLLVSICFFGINTYAGGFTNKPIRSILQDIKERGKCRRIAVEGTSVRVHFMNSEDARIFANDLVDLINEE